MTKSKKQMEKLKGWNEATEKMALYHEVVCATRKKMAACQDALRAVAQSYQEDLDALVAEGQAYAAELRQFAEDHKQEFVAIQDGGEGRTRFRHGVEIGWRTSPPRVHITKRLFEKALRWLEEFGGDTYVRRDPEIARDAVKAELVRAEQARDQHIIDRFAGQGITLRQDEEFVLQMTDPNGG